MTINLRFDRFKKEIEGEVCGVILVTFSQNSITKVVSTKHKIKRVHFDKYFNKAFKRFTPTTVINSTAINLAIEEIINNKNPFIISSVPVPVVSDGYIAFVKKLNGYIPNLSTRKIYGYAISSFEDYLVTLDMTDIPLNELSIDVFRGYKAYLDGRLSYGTIKYYFTLHRSFIANGFDDERTDFVLSLKRFSLNNNGKKPTVLTDEDINKLRSVKRTDKLFSTVQFSLMQLFSNGIRFSDCLLIKLSDFKPNYVEVHQMKTNRVLHALYSPMLIDTVAVILGFDYTPSDNNLKNTLNDLLSDVNDVIIMNERQEHILEYIQSQTDRFLFDFVDPVLFSYKKGTDMNPEQHKRYILHRVNHNNHLLRLIKPLKLSVSTLSSHSMRYAYTRIALDNEIPLRTLSQSLGHSSITITEKYIRDNFQVENYKIIGEMWTKKYKKKTINEEPQ